jgi:acetoin utilization deacetylase AcuC-like enzyme
MRVLLSTHPDCLLHYAGAGHPERPGRIDAAVAGVERSGLEVVRRLAPQATTADLERVHSAAHVEAVRSLCASGGGQIDSDTAAVEASWSAALAAAGAGLDAAEVLVAGDAEVAFCAVRPPGHHADKSRAMGFCLFNNIAVVAAALRERGDRIAILDWDVHHGNGTQDAFSSEPDVLYLSLHEFPAYPGTGWVDELGRGAALGTTINVPLPDGTAGDAYGEAVDRIVAPVLGEFAPDWVLVSAGYDAHAADPLAGLRLVERDYHRLGATVGAVAPPCRTIILLEGGYDLAAVERSVAATLQGYAGLPLGAGSERETLVTQPASSAWRIVDYVTEMAAAFWQVR